MKPKTRIAALLIVFSTGVSAQNLTISTGAGTEDDCDIPMNTAATVTYSSNGLKVEVDGENLPTCAQGGGGGAVGGTPNVTASKHTVNEDDQNKQVQISWTLPDATVPCTLRKNGASFLSDAQLRTSSTRNETIGADTTYTLSCSLTKSNNEGSISASATAVIDFVGGSVEPPPTGEMCTAQLSGFSRGNTVSYRISLNDSLEQGQTYAEVWGPWGTNGSAFITSPGGTYYSLPFSIDSGLSSTADARLQWADNGKAPTGLRMSVSECIGAPMAESAVSESCYLQAPNPANGGFSMKQSGVGCVLQKGRTYYFNFAFATADGSNACATGTCEWHTTEN